MQNEERLDRAKQFMSFDSLRGFREALQEKEKSIVHRMDFNPEYESFIDDILHSLKIGDEVVITYYDNYQYVDKRLIIKKISFTDKTLYLNKIGFNYIDIKNIRVI